MKVKIKASSYNSNGIIIEVNSIDEAIKRVQTDKDLVKSIIDYDRSWLTEDLAVSLFILYTDIKGRDCDAKLIIYDDYWE